MNCPTLHSLKLDNQSKQAVDKIRHGADLTRLLSGALSLGSLSGIFTRSSALQASYNIYNTDFVSFAKAMDGISKLRRRTVHQIALSEYLRVGDFNQRQFWRAIYEGCTP
jgi:hypothetical protein